MIQYNLPLFMSIERGLLEKISYEIKRNFYDFCDKKILLITSEDLLKKFFSSIEKLKADFPQLKIILIKESSFDNSVELAKYIYSEDFKLILGLGGGAVLDTTKYASFISKTIYIAIPTTLSNDGLASPISVLYYKNNKKKSFGSKIPDGIIIDTDVIINAPLILLKAGVGDTLSNYTALFDWKLDCDVNKKKMNDFAYMLSEMSFNMLLYSQEKALYSETGIRMLAQSLVLSGLAMEMAGNSRPCSGSEHLFSHAIDELYDLKIPHGILVALGSIVACMLQKRDYGLLLNYLKRYEIDINPLNLGISKEQFIQAWLYARDTRKERYTILNTVDINYSLFEQIFYRLLEV